MIRGFEGAEERGLAEGLVVLPGLALLLVVHAAAADEGSFLKAGRGFEGESAEGGERRHGGCHTVECIVCSCI